MNIIKLKELCKKFTVKVSFNGFMPFKHEVIDANLLLEVIHEVSDLPKAEFIANINEGNYMSPELESIFKNIQNQGVFMIAGHEELKNHSYIECKSLEWL